MATPTPARGGTKPGTADTGPTIRYEGTTVYIKSLIAQLERIDNIAHAEFRKVQMDGVRSCLKKNGKEPLDLMAHRSQWRDGQTLNPRI